MKDSKVFNFERLRVWQKSKELAKSVYDCTGNSHFPDEEKYNLVLQMRRCSISISSNIAEGMTRITRKDKCHFLTIAYGSAIELLNQAILSYELKFIDFKDYHHFRLEIDDICSMLSGLKKSLNAKH